MSLMESKGSLPEWGSPPTDLALHTEEVHVWRIELDTLQSAVGEFHGLLSSDERERARAFHKAKDRNRYVIVRGTMRTILARYVATAPENLEFAYNGYGKPSLTGHPARPPLQFNLSHSHELAIVAAAWGVKVGIDIEHWRENLASQEIAERFFSPLERAALRSLPREQQHAAFYRCWTRKEAYLKARGEGLSLPLHQFTVSLGPGEPAALLHTTSDPQEALEWSLVDLKVGPWYSAALAVEGRLPTISYWRWMR